MLKYETEILGNPAEIIFDRECGRWCGFIEKIGVFCEESTLPSLLDSMEACARDMMDFRMTNPLHTESQV